MMKIWQRSARMLKLLGLPVNKDELEFMYRYRLDAKLAIERDLLVISDIDVIGENNLKVEGSIIYQVDKERPELEISLRSDGIDFTAFETLWYQGYSLHESPTIRSDHPFGFEWLIDWPYNLTANLRLGDYRLFGDTGGSLSTSLNIRPGVIAFSNIKGDYAKTQLFGKWQIMKADRQVIPNIFSDLRLGHLQLGDLGMSAIRDPGTLAWSELGLNFSAMDYANIEMNLKVDHFEHVIADIERLQMRIILKDKVLRFNDIRGRMYSGDMKGELSLDADGIPSLSVSLQHANANLRRALMPYMPDPLFNGQFSSTTQMNLSGVSFSDWIANLSGNIRFSARNLLVEKLNLPIMTRALQSAKSVKDVKDIVDTSLGQGRSRFVSLSGGLSFAQGSGKWLKTRLDSAEVRGDIEGSLDINQRQMDMTTTLWLKLLSKDEPPPLRFIFNGAWDEPVTEIETRGLESFALKNQ